MSASTSSRRRARMEVPNSLSAASKDAASVVVISATAAPDRATSHSATSAASAPLRFERNRHRLRWQNEAHTRKRQQQQQHWRRAGDFSGNREKTLVVLDSGSDEDDDNDGDGGGKMGPAKDAALGGGVIDLLSPSLSGEKGDDASTFASASNRKRRRVSAIYDVDVVEIERTNAQATSDETPLSRVLSVFPDVDPDYAACLLRNEGMRNDDVRQPMSFDPMGRLDMPLEGRIQGAILKLLDDPSYPRKMPQSSLGIPNAKGKGDAGADTNVEVVRRRRPYLYDYSSSSPFEPSERYRAQVSKKIAETFPFLLSTGIDLYLKKYHGRFYPVHKRVVKAIIGSIRKGRRKRRGGGNDTKAEPMRDLSDEDVSRLGQRYRRLESLLAGETYLTSDEAGRLRVGGERTTRRGPRCRRQVAGAPPRNGGGGGSRRSMKRDDVDGDDENDDNDDDDAVFAADVEEADQVLEDEIRYASEMLANWPRDVLAKYDRLRARRKSQNQGINSYECGCCYVDGLAFEELVSCRSEGHLFCVDCVRKHAEERVFGVGSLDDGEAGWGRESGGGGGGTSARRGAPELRCMRGGCGSGFSEDLLRKALPVKVMEKYDEIQAKAALDEAAVHDLCTCPKCDYQAELPMTERIFRCPVADCRYESCRDCGEPPHIPLRCSEVEKKHETDGRRTVEEAMTEARVRTCPRYPRCKRRFYKTDGCNKMTCPPPCGAFVCYVCRAEIPKDVGYKHFCQTPHCKHETCKMCPLYSNAAEDDLRAAKEAGLKAAEQVRQKSLAEGGGGNRALSASSGGGSEKGKSSGEVVVDVEALLRCPS